MRAFCWCALSTELGQSTERGRRRRGQLQGREVSGEGRGQSIAVIAVHVVFAPSTTARAGPTRPGRVPYVAPLYCRGNPANGKGAIMFLFSAQKTHKAKKKNKEQEVWRQRTNDFADRSFFVGRRTLHAGAYGEVVFRCHLSLHHAAPVLALDRQVCFHYVIKFGNDFFALSRAPDVLYQTLLRKHVQVGSSGWPG